MAERAVDLPKPHPDDDEDVVDWLSTAQTLWTRGERADALVWLRRASEAAASAGQPFRASEIGMYVTALEETFGELPAPRGTTPLHAAAARSSESRREQDTLVDRVEAFGQLASEVLRTKLTSIDVELVDDDTLTEDAPPLLASEAAPPPPPPLAKPSQPAPSPPTAARPMPPAARESHEAKVIVQAASVPQGDGAAPAASSQGPPAPAASTGGSVRPPPVPAASAGGSVRPPPVPAASRSSSGRTSVRPQPSSFTSALPIPISPEGDEITLVSADYRTGAARPPGRPPSFGTSPLAATPAPSAARTGSTGLPPPPPPPTFGAPPPAVPRPPPTPAGLTSPWVQRSEPPAARLSAPSSAPPPPSGNNTPSAPPSLGISSSSPSGSGSSPSSSQHHASQRRPSQRKPRQPILDPWAEEQAAAPGAAAAGPKTGSEEVVVVRARFPSIHDDDEVFTSAAPLPPALRRRDAAAAATPAAPSEAVAPPVLTPPPVAPPAPVAPPVSISPMVVAPAAPAATPAPPVQPGRLINATELNAKSVPPPARTATAPTSPALEPATKPAVETVVAKPVAEAVAAKPASDAVATKLASQPPRKAAAPSNPAAPRPSAPGRLPAIAPPAAAVAPAPAKVPTIAPPPAAVAPAPAKVPTIAPPPAAVAPAPAKVPTIAPPPAAVAPAPAKVPTIAPPAVPKPLSPAVKPAPASVLPSEDAAASSHEAASRPAFDPARATLPMMLEIEPMPIGPEMPSMRATIPMPMELPKELAALLTVSTEPPVVLEGVRLDEIDAFAGMRRAVHEMLRSRAEIVRLGSEEEVGGFAGALVLSGSAIVCATIVDAAAHWARPGELLAARGSLPDSIALRVVGAGDGAIVAIWTRAVLDEAFGAQPGSAARARARGDRLQALAGATMGPFGEIGDDERRALAEELVVRSLRPGEIWLEGGGHAPAIALVGAGEIELYGPISEETSESVEPGGLLFPELGLAGGEAPSSARAGAHGALLLLADGDVAKKMLARVPDLAERLRG